MRRPEPGSSSSTKPEPRSVDEIRRLNWTLAAIRNVNRVLIRTQSEHDLFTGVCRALTRQGFFSLAWVGVPKDDAERSVEIFAAAGTARGYLKDLKISWGDGPYAAGPTGIAIKTGKIQVDNSMAYCP